MSKYNDFDLDMQEVKVEQGNESNGIITVRTVGPIYSCYIVCPATDI